MHSYHTYIWIWDCFKHTCFKQVMRKRFITPSKDGFESGDDWPYVKVTLNMCLKRRARTMTVYIKKMWNHVGPRREANPEYTGAPGVRGSHRPGEIVPEMSTPEDSDESDRPHERKMKNMRLYQSDAKEGKCNYKSVSSVETLCFEKAARACNHKHISIAYLL